jgi:AraC family transcriptional regulator, regulatory protein of adaptative response / methylated-DNA-[protein]-cysteine methyltransferase
MDQPPPFPSNETGASPDDERWDAVRRRDRAADGRFVYAVTTTGVYCKPSCPSRPAKRENVTFHPTNAAAEMAGFRPCKRCRPTDGNTDDRHAEGVAQACRRIEQAVRDGDPAPTLAELAALSGLSPFHYHRVFKLIAGVTPKAFATACKAALARQGLARGRAVTETIYDAGYSSSSRFYDGATGRLGMRPSDYRAGGRGAEIRFAVGACSLGNVLVAATNKGVCVVQFGDDPQNLVEDLQDRFPKAKLVGGDADFEAMVAAVIGVIETPAQGCDLPLDVQGTAFQHRVWQALRAIPAGSTASYADIAQQIGQPKAVRAVARACAANPAAVIIPCHRVVRTNGALSGYAWGVERKRALLDREEA